MFHHVAMFRFRDDVTAEEIADVRRRLVAMPDTIDVIREFRVGRDAGLSDASWDMVVVAAFDDADGYREYAAHPDHVPIVEDIRRLATDRVAVQSTEL